MINIIDLFSGIGGLTYGFYKNENFKIIAANEIDKDAAKGYCLNHEDVKMYNCDISKFSKLEFEKNFSDTKINIIIGGPPCQSYSTLGKRQLDNRSNLYLEYGRILKEFSPQMFVFENVTGLLSMKNKTLFPEIIDFFKELGYYISYKVLNALDFGVPQNRERIILVGSKSANKFVFPSPVCSPGEYLTLKDAISDLQGLKSNQELKQYPKSYENNYQKNMRLNCNYLTEHKVSKHSEKLIELMEALPDGGTPLDVPESIRPKSGFTNTYCKLWWGKPAFTITRNFGTPSSSRCIHPIDSRALTTREGARLQSFPDDFKFFGSKSKKNLQIGNAVPPLLSTYLANTIYEYYSNTF